MINQLTALDIQFIRASLTTKSDGEIASILEIPVGVVYEKINEITGGQAESRSLQIQKIHEEKYSKILELQEKKHQQELAKQKREKELQERRIIKAAAEEKKEQKRKEQAIRMNREEARQVEKKVREGRGKFITRDLQLHTLISVKIDNKTTVLVRPGTNIEKVKAQYSRTLEETIKPKN